MLTLVTDSHSVFPLVANPKTAREALRTWGVQHPEHADICKLVCANLRLLERLPDNKPLLAQTAKNVRELEARCAYRQ